MYLEYFGFERSPFTITPDTSFFLDHGSHREAMNVLQLALQSGEGFIKVTGEVGTGKTLLCRQLLNTLDERFLTAYIPNPCLDPLALHKSLAAELGIKFAHNIGQHRLLQRITKRLMELSGAHRQVVLLLDEAQSIPDDSMEALRLLTNLETEKDKLLKVVLFGQPELDHRLQQHSMRQLRQRILFNYTLQPLDRDTLDIYLNHRLLIAGYRGAPLFTRSALKLLHRNSRGIPRLANILSHKALMSAYGRGDHLIRPLHIRHASADTEDVRSRRYRLVVATGLLGVAGTGLFATWY
ncbi:MAG: AAA family ATPase [Gammaproteobacteria bacterium]